MTTLRVDYEDGGAAPAPSKITAADMVDISTLVNANTAKLSNVKVINALAHGADPTGVADSAGAINEAFTALSAYVIDGGVVYLPVGDYKIASVMPVAQLQGLVGDGKEVTVLNHTGSGPCILAGGGTIDGLPRPVTLKDFSIYGGAASAGAQGLSVGNCTSSVISNVNISHYDKTGSIGCLWKNAGVLPYSDRMSAKMEFYYCTDAIVFDGDGGGSAPGPATFDYCEFEFNITNNANQNGISFINGVNVIGCRLAMHGDYGGSISGNTGWVLGFDQTGTGSSLLLNTAFEISVEANPVPRSSGMAAIGHKTIVLGSASTQSNVTGSGVLMFYTGSCAFQGASIHAGSRLGVSGLIYDPVLGQTVTGDGLAVQGGSQWSVWGSATTALVNGQTISPQLGDIQEYLLTSGAQSIGAITTGAAGKRARKMRVLWHQPASGAPGTLTLPANVHCIGSLSTTNGASDLMDLTYFPSDDAWYGEIIGRTVISPIATSTKTADYTAAVNDLVLMSGAHTVTLPTAPADGSRVTVLKMDAGTVTTIAAGGSDTINVASGATSVVLLGQYQSNVLQYTASNGVWHIVSSALSLSYLNSLYTSNLSPSPAIKTADYTAVVSDLVLMNGAHTVTLPTAPADKSRVGVIKMDSSTVTTVASGGSDVFNVGGGTTTVSMLLQYECKIWQYSSANAVWYLVSGSVPLASYDGRYLNQNTTGTAAGITGKATPTGALVGTTDTQALTHKDLTDATNTFPTLNQSTSGNAATATKLATARNIDGQLFDGSADMFTQQWIGQLSAYTLANQTAAQALFATTAPTNGALSLGIGTYEFECAFLLSGMSSTSGSYGFAIVPAASGGATFTQAWQANAAKPVGIAAGGAPSTSFNTAANTAIATANTNTAGNAMIKGMLRVTAAGLIVPQVSLGIAAAAVVNAGSYFKIKQISASATVASVGSWS